MTVYTGLVRRLRAQAQVASWQERLEVVRPPAAGWWRRALCAGLEAMVTESCGETAIAVAVCSVCPVRLSCLGEARLVEADHDKSYLCGVRGGLTGTQRAAVYSRPPRGMHPLVALVMEASDGEHAA